MSFQQLNCWHKFCILFCLQTALVSPNEEQYELLLKKIKERIEDGRGETIFDIGVGVGEKKIIFSSCSPCWAINRGYSVVLMYLTYL
jgi:hypothetical protein